MDEYMAPIEGQRHSHSSFADLEVKGDTVLCDRTEITLSLE